MALVQDTASVTGVTTAAQTITGVTAGNRILAFCANTSGPNPSTHTCSDGQGSYTQGASIGDSTTNTYLTVFELLNANAGSHTVTFTTDSGNGTFIYLVEMTGPTTGASPSAANTQNSPGTVHGAVTSSSVTNAVSATLVGFCVDASSGSSSDQPAVDDGSITGNVFTLIRHGDDGATFGEWTTERKAISGNMAATFTAITGTHSFATVGIAVPEPGGGGGGTNPLPQMIFAC